MSEREILIYLGTHKLVGVNAILEKGEVRVHDYQALKNPEGFEHGLVTHLDKAANTLQNLIERLVPDRGIQDLAVWVVLGNAKLKTYGFSSSEYYPSTRTLSSQEVRSVIHQTKSVATLPLSEFVLQALPEAFLVNDMAGVQDPIGLEANRLGVDLKIFTMDFQDFRNIVNAFEASDIGVKGYFPRTLTSSEAVLSAKEKDEGAIVLDIADDSTQLVLWKNGCLLGTKVLPWGSRYLTEKISTDWEIDFLDAERVKEQYASLEPAEQFGEELLPLVERHGRGAYSIRRQEFQEKFLSQSKQWLDQILRETDAFVRDQKVLHPHQILTGGGTRLDGLVEFLQKEFSREARMGVTHHVDAPTELLSDPSLAPVLGMCRWLQLHERTHHRLLAPTGVFERTLASAKEWFAAYF